MGARDFNTEYGLEGEKVVSATISGMVRFLVETTVQLWNLLPRYDEQHLSVDEGIHHVVFAK